MARPPRVSHLSLSLSLPLPPSLPPSLSLTWRVGTLSASSSARRAACSATLIPPARITAKASVPPTTSSTRSSLGAPPSSAASNAERATTSSATSAAQRRWSPETFSALRLCRRAFRCATESEPRRRPPAARGVWVWVLGGGGGADIGGRGGAGRGGRTIQQLGSAHRSDASPRASPPARAGTHAAPAASPPVPWPRPLRLSSSWGEQTWHR
jgi:hypothetical protein